MNLSVLSPLPPGALDATYHDIGHAAAMLGEKCAADAVVVHSLSGRLYLSKGGWLLLSVPNALGRGAFDALRVTGAELPTRDTNDPNAAYNAHVTVMSPDEIATFGGPDKITERGHDFHYSLGAVKEVNPTTWAGVSKVWYITVDSPELRNLRKSYGLTPTRKGEDMHITFAIKRTGVERNNDVSKFDVDHDRESSLTLMKTAFEQWQEHALSEFIDKLATAKTDLIAAIEEARSKTEANPTDAQKQSGNYPKGRVTMHGLPLTLETAKGTTRSGTNKAGKAWSIVMAHDYGYIRRTTSEADGDHLDVFIGPDPDSYMVFAVDQYDPETGLFDEGKFMLGFKTKAEAEQGYRDCYDANWKGFGKITSLHLNEFKDWIENGDTSKPYQKAGEAR